MSLIETVSPKDATGEVAAIYEQIQKSFGMVPNGVTAFSSSQHRLKAQVGEMGYYFSHPTLSKELTAAIRYVVAAEYDCEYCVMVNSMMLKSAGWDEKVVENLVGDPASASLDGKNKAMFLGVLKAIRTPKEFNESDMSELRALGWSDGEILDAVAHGANSMAFDRILSAFDVQPDGK